MSNHAESVSTEARFRQLNFDRAAKRYDSVSEVQRIMAERLVDLLSGGVRTEKVLEIGCGTGHLSEQLMARCGGGRFLFTDVSESMLRRSYERLAGRHARRARWRELDARAPDWGLKERFHLVASSAVVQWFRDLTAHLTGVARCLEPRGHYLVAGFRTDNLPELAGALSRIDVAPSIGHSPEALERACSVAGLRLARFATDELQQRYASARELLDTLRSMGASRYPGTRPLRRRALQELLRDYEARHASPRGVAATWRTWYALARR